MDCAPEVFFFFFFFFFEIGMGGAMVIENDKFFMRYTLCVRKYSSKINFKSSIEHVQ